MKQTKNNFTLIELMIVIAVIAIVATIGIPQFLDARRNTNEKTAIANLRTLITDQETYKTENSIFGTLVQLGATGKVNLTSSKAGFSYTDLIVAPTNEFFAVKGVPSSPGGSGKKVYATTKTFAVRTDPAVIAGFAIDNASGVAAIAASAMLAIIPPGSEQTGTDTINTFELAK